MSYKAPWPIYVVRGFVFVAWVGMLAYLRTEFGAGAFSAGLVILLCGAFDTSLRWAIEEKREEHEGVRPFAPQSGSIWTTIFVFFLVFVGGIVGASLLFRAFSS